MAVHLCDEAVRSEVRPMVGPGNLVQPSHCRMSGDLTGVLACREREFEMRM